MRWPWTRQPETRETSTGTGGYAGVILEAVETAAAGTGSPVADATAAAETAAGLYARAFAGAEVRDGGAGGAALTPEVLGTIGRAMVSPGESVHLLRVRDGRVTLYPAGSWTIEGGPYPEAWSYRLDIDGPTQATHPTVEAAAVVHCRYSVAPLRPWAGIGPLRRARLSGTLMAWLEQRLGEEASAPVAHLLPVPQDGASEGLQPIRVGIAKAKGAAVLLETTAGGFGEGAAAAPQRDWRGSRLGADPPDVLPELRSGAALAVAAACGVPPVLLSGGDGTAMREAWRQFLFGTIAPTARLVERELRAKLDAPSLRLDFGELRASDLAGRARAFQSMVGGGMEAAKAAALAGLMVD